MSEFEQPNPEDVIPVLDDDVPSDDEAEEADADAAHDGVLPDWDPSQFEEDSE